MLTSGKVWDPSSIGDVSERTKSRREVHFSAPSSIILKTRGASASSKFPTIIHLRQLTTYDVEEENTSTSFAAFAPKSPNFLNEVTSEADIIHGFKL